MSLANNMRLQKERQPDLGSGNVQRKEKLERENPDYTSRAVWALSQRGGEVGE